MTKLSEDHDHTGQEPCFTAIIDGLTKRELFAAMAMQGLYAGYYASKDGVNSIQTVADRYHIAPSDIVAKASREAADALIAELNK